MHSDLPPASCPVAKPGSASRISEENFRVARTGPKELKRDHLEHMSNHNDATLMLFSPTCRHLGQVCLWKYVGGGKVFLIRSPKSRYSPRASNRRTHSLFCGSLSLPLHDKQATYCAEVPRKYLLDVIEQFFEGVLVFHDLLLQAL